MLPSLKRLKSDYVVLIALLAVVTLLSVPILTYPLGRDQGEFATIARGLLNGRIPYKDLWNPKPPAVFYVYGLAMTLFGQTSAALRAIDLIIVPIISMGLWWLGKTIANQRVGLWAALLFPVFYFTETFWTLTQNDGIALLPMILAIVCLVKAVNSQPKTPYGWLFLAGVLSGYVIWFKYPFALFGVALLAGYFFISLRGGSLYKKPVSPVVAGLSVFVGGVAFIVVGGVIYLQAIGAWDELVLSARVTTQYTALTFNPSEFVPLMQTAIGFRWQQWGLLWLLTGAWFFVRRWGEKRDPRWWIILLWAAAGLAIMLLQAKGYDYHWLPMLPPLCLMGADTLDRFVGWLGARHRTPIILSVCIGLLGILAVSIWPKTLPYLSGNEDQITYYSHFVAGEFTADESLKVTDFLRERVTAGDSLYIWGFRPEIYYMSGLNPATRFIFQFPLAADWYPPEWKKENVDTLWAALPPYVLVLQVDYMPWVTGSHEDSNTLLQQYRDLNDWLIFNYARETQIGNFFLWKRKP